MVAPAGSSLQDARGARSAGGWAGGSWKPSPIDFPPFTITAPTSGLGLVLPCADAASSIALYRCFRSRSVAAREFIDWSVNGTRAMSTLLRDQRFRWPEYWPTCWNVG